MSHDGESVWWQTPPFVLHIRPRRTARRMAREVVLEHGWWTLQWPSVRANFPWEARWTANLAAVYAVIAGIVSGLKHWLVS